MGVNMENACMNGRANGAPPSVKQHAKLASNLPEVYPSNKLDCSDEEWRARVDLAALYRLCHKYGFNEGVNNHLTCQVPGQEDRFLVFPFGLLWNEVTASCLLVVDEQGNVVSGDGQPEATAFYIHAAIHKGHPAAGCVVHTHQSWATSLCCVENPELPMIHQNSLRFYNDWAVDKDYNGLVLTESAGNKMCKMMQGKKVLLHANHGVMIATETIAEAWDYMYYLERAAEVTVKALSTGKPLKLISTEACKDFQQFKTSGVAKEYARLHLEAMKRDLLRGPDKDFPE
eukprot:jgi/Astpho2/3193/Aster-05723